MPAGASRSTQLTPGRVTLLTSASSAASTAEPTRRARRNGTEWQPSPPGSASRRQAEVRRKRPTATGRRATNAPSPNRPRTPEPRTPEPSPPPSGHASGWPNRAPPARNARAPRSGLEPAGRRRNGRERAAPAPGEARPGAPPSTARPRTAGIFGTALVVLAVLVIMLVSIVGKTTPTNAARLEAGTRQRPERNQPHAGLGLRGGRVDAHLQRSLLPGALQAQGPTQAHPGRQAADRLRGFGVLPLLRGNPLAARARPRSVSARSATFASRSRLRPTSIRTPRR